MFKKLSAGLLAAAVLLIPGVAAAHVTIQPATVSTGEFKTFTVSVPNEKDQAVTEVKLELPKGLGNVKPTVKNGWTITPQKAGEGKDANITSITWSGGTIPSGLRDDFTFSAQAPESESEIIWKAYQTYADGTVASWDQSPTTESEKENSGPYSTTKVVDGLETENSAATSSQSNANTTLPIALSLLAIAISVGGLLFSRKR